MRRDAWEKALYNADFSGQTCHASDSPDQLEPAGDAPSRLSPPRLPNVRRLPVRTRGSSADGRGASAALPLGCAAGAACRRSAAVLLTLPLCAALGSAPGESAAAPALPLVAKAVAPAALCCAVLPLSAGAHASSAPSRLEDR